MPDCVLAVPGIAAVTDIVVTDIVTDSYGFLF
jgi:hypothetical protein